MAFSKLQLYAPDSGSLMPVKPVQHGSRKIWSVYRGRELVWRMCKVQFVDWNGSQLKYEEVVLGHSATPPVDPTRPGYVFDGWWPQYANIQANTTVEAQYHQACHLELHAVPPSGGIVGGAGYYDQGERVEVRASPASGYSFSNWSDGGSQTHSVVIDGSKSLSAYFVESQIVTVRFIDWDGRLLKSQAVVYGSDATPPLSPSRAGYTFDHWEGSWTHVTENRDVIATYTANQYRVTFNPDGGTVSPTSKLVTFGAEYGELPTPDHSHDSQQVFSFAGWFTEPDGEGALVEENTLVSTPSDHTLYADWNETTYFIVRFIDWNGDLLKEAFCGYDEDIPDEEVPPDPIREGYTFDHWEGSWTHVTENRDVIATYTADYITLTYDSNDRFLTPEAEWEIYEEGRGHSNNTSRGNDAVGYNFGTIGKSINKMKGQADEHTFTMQQLDNACNCSYSPPSCYYWVKLARYPLYDDGTRATDKVTYYLVQKRSIHDDTDTIWHISNHAIINTGISNPLYGEVTGVGFSGYPEEHENFQISVDGKTAVEISATIDPNSGITAYSGIQILKLLGSTPGNTYNTGVSVGDNLQLFQIYHSYYNERNGYWKVFAKNGQTYSYTVPLGSDSYTTNYTINNNSDDTINIAKNDPDIYTVWQTSYPLYRLNDDSSITPMTYFYRDNGKEHGGEIPDA